MTRCATCGRPNDAHARFCGGCGAPVASGDVGPGTALGDGRYRLVRRLGAGGMGTVFRATDERLGRSVAIKILNAELTQHPTARRRMEQEARALAKVDHPNVVRVLDVLEHDDRLVLVLEFVPGGEVAAQMDGRPWPAQRAATLMQGVLAGLEALHDQGLIHRDVKPENLLLAGDGTPKITDLGVARDASAQRKTQLGAVIGTAEFMAPEQVQGLAVDRRADIYAAGLVMFQLLAGVAPFDATTDFGWYVAHAQTPPDMGRLPAETPEALRAAVARALAKDPAERWATAAAFAGALDLRTSATTTQMPVDATPARMRAIRDARARETPPPAEPAAVAAQVVTAASAPTSAPERGKSWLWLAGIAAVLLVVAGAAAVALLVPANDPGEPASSVEARESIRTIQANVLASRKLGVKKPTVLASERDSNRARSNCTLDPRWPGDYALTTQVDGKGTRGRYHLRIEASSCRLAIRVTRDGFTVGTGPLLSKPDYRGHAEGVLSPWPTDPARFATHLRFTNSVGTPPLYIRMDFRLRDDGELEGVWAYEKSSFKVGFHGPARAVRVNSIRYGAHPDLDGWGRLSSDTRTLEHCMVLKDSDEEATWHCAGAR